MEKDTKVDAQDVVEAVRQFLEMIRTAECSTDGPVTFSHNQIIAHVYQLRAAIAAYDAARDAEIATLTAKLEAANSALRSVSALTPNPHWTSEEWDVYENACALAAALTD